MWSWWTDLNPRPADYKSAALPTELHQRAVRKFLLTSERMWSWWTDLNPRPADYKSAALPTELHQRAVRKFLLTSATLFILSYHMPDVNNFLQKNAKIIFRVFLRRACCSDMAQSYPLRIAKESARTGKDRGNCALNQPAQVSAA